MGLRLALKRIGKGPDLIERYGREVLVIFKVLPLYISRVIQVVLGQLVETVVVLAHTNVLDYDLW